MFLRRQALEQRPCHELLLRDFRRLGRVAHLDALIRWGLEPTIRHLLGTVVSPLQPCTPVPVTVSKTPVCLVTKDPAVSRREECRAVAQAVGRAGQDRQGRAVQELGRGYPPTMQQRAFILLDDLSELVFCPGRTDDVGGNPREVLIGSVG